MNPVAIQLGPFSIRWYAICIILGLLLAVILSMKEAPRKGIESDDIIDFILIAFPVAIIGPVSTMLFFDGHISGKIQERFLPYGTVGSLSMVDSWQELWSSTYFHAVV